MSVPNPNISTIYYTLGLDVNPLATLYMYNCAVPRYIILPCSKDKPKLKIC